MGDHKVNARFETWSHEEHHADTTAIGFSTLKKMGEVTEDQDEVNPGLFRAHLSGDVGGPDTAALRFGTVAHLARYEPELLAERVAVRPTKPNGDLVRANSNAFQEWAEEHAGKIFIRPDEMDVIEALVDTFRSSPAVQKIDRLEVVAEEQSITWTDPEFGIRLKIRPDRILVRPDGVYVIEDLKTTTNPSPRAFLRDCEKYRYFDRAAFYADGLESAIGHTPRFVLVAVGKQEPYQAAVYEPRPHRFEEGRIRNRALLREVVTRMETHNWLAPWEMSPVQL